MGLARKGGSCTEVAQRIEALPTDPEEPLIKVDSLMASRGEDFDETDIKQEGHAYATSHGNDTNACWKIHIPPTTGVGKWKWISVRHYRTAGGRVEIQSQKCNLVQWAVPITTWFGKATSTAAAGGSEKEVKDFKSILASFG